MKSLTTNLILAPDAAIDLQTHTIHSDGTWTPDQLMDYFVSEQFALAAITDHDRVDTVASLQKLSLEKNLPLLPAVEMTTSWEGDMTDVLCYGFDPDNNALNDVTLDVLRRQQDNTREVYENLRRQGYFQQETDELTPILQKPSAQQPHELVAVFKKYSDGTEGVSPGKIITDAGFFFATTDIAAVVDAAHRSGAVCLLAHPGRDDGFTPFTESRLDQLRAEVPIDGFEVYYPLHTPEQTAMYLDYAKKHDLLTSSGSDSHSPDKKPIKYRADLSRNLLERLGIQVK